MRPLLTQGYLVEEAENEEEGLAVIDQGHTFDRVISDNQMPVMTGIECI